ncbi:MAG TPA: group III truncated hemoglobin [Ferruginibacter sp.]|nr:group III truncated hemoglobin [Ferruginibacter sp.]
MKKDIAGRKDIELLVSEFYKKVQQDPTIGYIFSDIAKVNWEKHLPVMYDFFENMLFYTGSYTGNPMQLHKNLNRVVPLTSVHFDQWYYLFSTTVDELFEGETASLAKQRAQSIATVMQLKIRDEHSLPGKGL